MSRLSKACLIQASVLLLSAGFLNAAVFFDQGQNVNLMNSYAVSVTAAQQVVFPGLDANNLRSAWIDSSFWDGGNNPAGGTNALTVNFGTTRNLRTINLEQYPGSEGTAFTVETSTNGTTWISQSATFTPSGTPNATHGQLVLSSASPVNAQYLRMTATSINDGNGTDRWILQSMRVLGDTGTLVDPTGTLDLVSGTGGPGGGTVSLTRNGTVSETDTNDSQFVDDGLYPIQRQVLFNMGTNDGFTLHWSDTNPITFQRIGLYFPPANYDASATFAIDVSSDGTTFTNALTQVGGMADGMNYYTLTTPTQGEYLRFTWTSTGSADNRISDVQVFGSMPVPEPASAAVVSLIGAALVSRRYR